MSKRRFVAPLRGEVEAAVFSHPVYAEFQRFRGWMAAPDWPALADLNAALTLPGKRFVAQDRALLDDGLHYEVRIAERGLIATREANWHDFFNALVWCRHPAIKAALNARQYRHVGEMGAKVRNRAQYALTQFDEAGVIVQVQNPALLACWDRHDWLELFHAHAGAWQRGEIRIAAVIGHALLEHALLPGQYMVGKALVVAGAGDAPQAVARAVAAGERFNDPLELRPLPLAGVPGWYPRQEADFYREAPCFQPLRPGRVYPPPLAAGQGSA